MAIKIVTYSTPEERLKSLKHVTAKKATQGEDINLPEPYNKIRYILEKDVLAGVKEVCSKFFDWHCRLDVQGKIMWGAGGGCLTPSQMRGMPDVIALKDGVMWAIECKCPGGKISSVQFATLSAMAKAGAKACIVVDANKFRERIAIAKIGMIDIY